MYKVLLAEDEDIIRKGLMFTADWGAWNCLVAGEASDGEEGVEKIRQIKPDIVVADIRMPVKSGLKCWRKQSASMDMRRLFFQATVILNTPGRRCAWELRNIF